MKLIHFLPGLLSISWTSSLELITIHNWFTTIWTLCQNVTSWPFWDCKFQVSYSSLHPIKRNELGATWLFILSSFCLHSVFILSAWHLDHPGLSFGRDTPGANQWEMGWQMVKTQYFVGVNFTRKSSFFKLRWQLKIIDNLILCKTIGRTTSLAHISAFQLCLCRRQRGRTTHDLALRTSGLPGLPPFVVWEWTEDGNCCAVKRSVLLHSPLSMVSPFSKPMPQLPGSVQHLAQLLLRWSLAVRDRNF